MSEDTEKRGRAATRPVAERHADRAEGRKRIGLTKDHKGQTKVPLVVTNGVRDTKLSASIGVLWSVTGFLDSLKDGPGYCFASQSTLGDAIGTDRKRIGRLLADDSPAFRNELDGKGPILKRAVQDQGKTLHLWAMRKVRGPGQMGGWAPTWTLTLVCDGASHEQLVPAQLISPDAWIAHTVMVWRAGDEGRFYSRVEDLAKRLGRSPRFVKEITRELRGGGLLLVQDRRGEARSGGKANAQPSHYIPVVVRGARPSGEERVVVDLLRQLPTDLPLELSWSLDSTVLDAGAGLVSADPARVGFGGWAAWRALTVLVSAGPVPMPPQALMDVYGVPEKHAVAWFEDAASAGLMATGEDFMWRPLLAAPGSVEAVAKDESMGHGLTQGMGHGLTQGMGHGLTHPKGHGLTHEVETLSNDPSYSDGSGLDVQVQEVDGESVPFRPKAAVVEGGASQRPSAGKQQIDPALKAEAQRILADPSVDHLLMRRLNSGQQAAITKLVAANIGPGQVAPKQMAYRLSRSLDGKSVDPASDDYIHSPYGWINHLVRKGWDCADDCTCPFPDCEGGKLWYDGSTCTHCEWEVIRRAGAAELKRQQEGGTAPRPQFEVVQGDGNSPGATNPPLLNSITNGPETKECADCGKDRIPALTIDGATYCNQCIAPCHGGCGDMHPDRDIDNSNLCPSCAQLVPTAELWRAG